MKSIRKEMIRNHLILLLVAFIFIASDTLANVDSSRRYNGSLRDYQQVNGLLTINNGRQTYLKLYSKSRDEEALRQYYGERGLFDSQLWELGGKMQSDQKCRMMYRIAGQAAGYRREMAESYIRPDGGYYPSLTADLGEADLKIERCLNQLTSQYLEYLNTAFAGHSRTLGLTNSTLVVFFMAVSLFGMALNHQTSTSILNSIKQPMDTAREIVSNNLGATDVEGTPYAELDQVSATFDQVKRQIRAMITELYKIHQMKERLAEVKIRELQMQMNPYFLFNTLSLIIRSIQLGEWGTSVQLVEVVSRILQGSVKVNTVSILLDEEIRLFRPYLYIQKLHLKGRMTFCLGVRKSFMGEDVVIPPLIIQPLVENNIQHGLKDWISGGKVDILITEKPDYIEVAMADNGVGFPKNSDQPSFWETLIPETSIGLENVEKWLGLFYRKEGVLQIGWTEGITKITPKLYESDGHQEERVMLRVILVDDEQYERNYLERVVKESYLGLLEIVCKVVDGVDLLKRLEECRPQIAPLDIKMPRMDRLKIVEEVRKRYSDIQIVLISAYSDSSFTKQVIKLGMTDCLPKPYLDSEPRETLDKIIARVREWEDALPMLSYFSYLTKDEEVTFDFYRDLEEDLLWDMFLGQRGKDKLGKEFAMWGVGAGQFKVVLISSPALINMGGFSQEVLKNYFHMAGMTVFNSIRMDQMTICLYSQQQDALTELTGCITHARNYLAEGRKIPVACGVSGVYEGMERLTQACGEAAFSTREYSAQEARPAFDSMTKGMKRICDLEEQIIRSLSREDQSQISDLPTGMVEELETLLGYQDVSIKLNFGRSLMTIIRGISQIPGIRVKTSEVARCFEKLGQLNFNGDNLKYHADYFSEMKIQRE